MRVSCNIFIETEERQSPIQGHLKWTNLFWQSNKVSIYDKLLYKSGVCFLILFILTDAILLNLDLQKSEKIIYEGK